MAKYLRGLDNDTENEKDKCGYELSKWLESAAKFTPEKNNYIEWNSKGLEIKNRILMDLEPFLSQQNYSFSGFVVTNNIQRLRSV